MLKILLAVLFFGFNIYSVEIKEESLKVSSGKVIFTNVAPHESFKGIGNTIEGNINMKTKKVFMKFGVGSLSTKMGMRDDHMHENYLESDKYPDATFTGELKSYDSKTGEAVVIGTMEVHGVKKENMSISGQISKSNEGYLLKSKFDIFLSEHNIKIPKLVFMKLNNQIVVNIEFILSP